MFKRRHMRLICMVTALLLALVSASCVASPPAATPSVQAPEPTAVQAVPTDTPAPATDTPVPPTDTPVPPTDSPEPAPPSLDGEALVQERCTKCHSLDRVVRARKSVAEWTSTVQRMVGKGADLTPDEQAAVIEYLAETYPADTLLPQTDTPVPPAPTEEPADALNAEALVGERCTACHTLDWVAQAQKSEAAWANTVQRMVGNGASLTPEEQAAVIKYLAETYPA